MVRILRGGNILFGSWIQKPDDLFIAKKYVNADLLLKQWTFVTPAVSSLDHMGKTALIRESYDNIVAGGFLLTLFPVYTNRTLLEYLNILFQSYFYRKLCQSLTNKSGQAFYNLSRTKLLNAIIPLPPLAEQHRIVEKIEKLLPIIKVYGEAYEEASKMDAELPDKLKKSILQDAIMGKLDTQDPNDEPASVLLEHIREEKKRLVKEGKLKKKDLIETPVEESEQPFKIPESWEWCRVEDYTNKVTDFVASGSFATLRDNVKYYKEENYALLVKTKDFQTNFNRDLTFTDKHGYEFLANSNLFGGELILSNVGSIGKIFIVPKLNRKMSLAPNAIMVRFWNEKHRDWLYYLFQSPFGLALLYEISSATAIRKFNKTDFKKLIIPLPPLAEQHRIVEKIEALFAEIDNMTINNITTNKEETKETEKD